MQADGDMREAAPEISGTIEDEHGRVEFQEAGWDRPYFGRPVVQINDFVCKDRSASTGVVDRLLETCRTKGVALVSCRMGLERMAESMLLEQHGFRHVEVVLHPELRLDRLVGRRASAACGSRLAIRTDLAELDSIARTAFVNERFYVDPRIDRSVAASRYAGWVKSALTHPSQRLHVILFEARMAGFFVVERQPDDVCYWHLNAISPDLHGRGVGKSAWQLMMAVAEADGCVAVRTCIAVRNLKVMNLYASLGFRFLDPAMTLHWIP